jgi:hypothetical protein
MRIFKYPDQVSCLCKFFKLVFFFLKLTTIETKNDKQNPQNLFSPPHQYQKM